MKDTIPTIEELTRKSATELSAMFRKAVETAESAGTPHRARRAARETLRLIALARHTLGPP